MNTKQRPSKMERQTNSQVQRYDDIETLRRYIGLANTNGATALIKTLLKQADGSVSRVKLELKRSATGSKINAGEVIKRYYRNEVLPGRLSNDNMTNEHDNNDIPGSIMYLTVNYNEPQLRGTKKGGDTSESAYYNRLIQEARETQEAREQQRQAMWAEWLDMRRT